jgi:hypothetical protein
VGLADAMLLSAVEHFLPFSAAGAAIVMRTVILAAAWYLIAGTVVLMLTSASRTLGPWDMGLPFGMGQRLLAAILRIAEGDADAETD